MMDMVEQLAKENTRMPKGMIMDLVKMYNQLTPQQRQTFDDEMETFREQQMERQVKDELDHTSVLHFVNNKEADDFLRQEGKLVDDNINEDESYQ